MSDKQQQFIFIDLEAVESKMKVLAGVGSGEDASEFIARHPFTVSS